MTVNRPFTRDQRATIVYGMLAFVLMLVVLQLWLLTATMNAYLGGDEAVIWPAAGGQPGLPAAQCRPAAIPHRGWNRRVRDRSPRCTRRTSRW